MADIFLNLLSIVKEEKAMIEEAFDDMVDNLLKQKILNKGHVKKQAKRIEIDVLNAEKDFMINMKNKIMNTMIEINKLKTNIVSLMNKINEFESDEVTLKAEILKEINNIKLKKQSLQAETEAVRNIIIDNLDIEAFILTVFKTS